MLKKYLLVFILTFFYPFELFASVDVYISPAGSDKYSGVSVEFPVKTFKHAIDLVKKVNSDQDVEIKFMPGNYGRVMLDLAWFPDGIRRIVLRGNSMGGRAVFDGGGGGDTWLVVRGFKGGVTKVVVKGFHIKNYRGAIAFYGDRFDADSWSSSNRIENNIFENIGQFKEAVRPAFGAITLSNSVENIIVRNRFFNIRNIVGCDGLHAIYLSGGSSRNRIVENIFDGGCGDVIKVRDRSNDNMVKHNEFLNQTGKSIFVDSFCDARKNKECENKKQECASWGNKIIGNRIDKLTSEKIIAEFRIVGASVIDVCPVGEQKDRVITNE